MTPENHIDVLTQILEMETTKTNDMKKQIDLMIEHHEKSIKILEAIKTFDRRIELNFESLYGFPGTFLSLQKRYIHKIEIQRKCVERLIEYYFKTVKKILS